MEFTSYLDKLDNISLFKEDSFNKTIHPESGAYRIKIEAEGSRTLSKEDEGVYIIGVLKGGVQLNTSSNWGEFDFDAGMGGLVSNNPLLSFIRDYGKMATMVGGVDISSDLQSKKFYTGGSFLSLPLSFKVLDDDNTGKAIKALMVLLALSMPRNNSSIKLKKVVDALVERLPDNIENGVKKVENYLENLVKKVPGAIEGGINKINLDNNIYYSKDFREGFGKVLENGYDQLANEELRLTESPPTVKITIGNWLELENMVIDSVNANFSEAQTEIGPQSVEIELNVSTRNKLLLDNDGIINGRGRVKIINKGNNVKVNSGTYA